MDFVYLRNVREVWFYERGTLRFFELKDERYAESRRSELSPEVDVDLLLRCMDQPSQTEAVRTLRRELRSK